MQRIPSNSSISSLDSDNVSTLTIWQKTASKISTFVSATQSLVLSKKFLSTLLLGAVTVIYLPLTTALCISLVAFTTLFSLERAVNALLLTTARNQSFTFLKRLLSIPFSSTLFYNLDTALNLMVRANNLDLVKLLLDKGAKVVHDDRIPSGPLYETEDQAMLDLLIENIDQSYFQEEEDDWFSHSPLTRAVEIGETEKALYFIKKGFDINKQVYIPPGRESMLSLALKNQDLCIIECLLEKGYVFDEPMDIYLLSNAGMLIDLSILKALLSALKIRNIDFYQRSTNILIDLIGGDYIPGAMELLKTKKIPIDTPHPLNNKTALGLAAEKGLINVVKEILQHYPKADCKNALVAVATSKNMELFYLILNHVVRTNPDNPDLLTEYCIQVIKKCSLSFDLMFKLYEICPELDINLWDLKGESLLRKSCVEQSQDTIAFCLDKENLEINKKDPFGLTPFSYIARSIDPEHPESFERFKTLFNREGVDRHAVDADGRTPFVYVCGSRNIEAINMYLDDPDGRTPFVYVCGSKNIEAINMYLDDPETDVSHRSIVEDISRLEDEDLLKKLLSHNKLDKQIAFQGALEGESEFAINRLLDDEGIDVTCGGNDSHTTRVVASFENDALMNKLVKHPRFSVHSSDYNSSLCTLIRKGCVEALIWLIGEKAINIKNDEYYRNVIFTEALKEGLTPIVDLIIKGQDDSLQKDYSRYAFQKAAQYGHKDLFFYLVNQRRAMKIDLFFEMGYPSKGVVETLLENKHIELLKEFISHSSLDPRDQARLKEDFYKHGPKYGLLEELKNLSDSKDISAEERELIKGKLFRYAAKAEDITLLNELKPFMQMTLQCESVRMGLWDAVYHSHIEVVDCLLENMPESSMQNAFADAAEYGKTKLFLHLYEKKQGVFDAVNSSGDTVMSRVWQCSGYKFPEMTDFLSELIRSEKLAEPHKKQCVEAAFYLAAKFGKVEELSTILKTYKIDVNTRFEGGKTALIAAAEKGHLSVVTYLVKHANADVKVTIKVNTNSIFSDKESEPIEKNAFSIALTRRSYDDEERNNTKKILEFLLLDPDLDVNLLVDEHNLPYEKIIEDYPGFIEKLVNHPKFDPTKLRYTWRTPPVVLAAKKGLQKIVDIMLKKSPVPINKIFLAAVEGGQLDYVKYLVENNKEIDLNSSEERAENSAFFLAVRGADSKMVEYLLSKGAKVTHEVSGFIGNKYYRNIEEMIQLQIAHYESEEDDYSEVVQRYKKIQKLLEAHSSEIRVEENKAK